jgi:hypothetical protein
MLQRGHITVMPKNAPLLRLIRIAPRSKTRVLSRYNLQIACHVKPNASSRREGIAAVSDDHVEVCVAALPKNGEANAAVTKVLAEVCGCLISILRFLLL